MNLAMTNTTNRLQLQAETMNNLTNCVVAWTAFGRQRFVQASTGNACLLGNLSHTFSSSRNIKCVNKITVVTCCCCFFQKITNIFIGFKVLSYVERCCFSVHNLLQFVKQLPCLDNVFALRVFNTTAKQQHNFVMLNGVVNPNTTTKNRTQFKQLFFQRFMIAKVTVFKASQPSKNFNFNHSVFQAIKPFYIGFCFFEFVLHGLIVSYRKQSNKFNLTTANTMSYFNKVSAKSLAGIETPNLQGDLNAPILLVAFFYVDKLIVLWWAGWARNGGCSLVAVVSTCSARHPIEIETSCVAVNLLYKEAIMPTKTLALDPSVISVVKDQLTTTSSNVADIFGKLHKNVIQKIENIECSPEFVSANFSAHVENIEAGAVFRESKYYQMTKDGFMFLVMSFTGKKAAQIKEAYINTFNAMAEKLLSKPNKLPQLETPLLTPAQQHHIQTHVKKLVSTQVGTTYASLYGSIKNHFKVGSYKNIPPERYGELCKFLNCKPLQGELLPKEEYSDLPHFSCSENKQHKLLPFNKLFDCGWNMRMSELFTFVSKCQAEKTPCIIDDFSGIKQEMRSLMNIVETQNNHLSRIHDLSKH